MSSKKACLVQNNKQYSCNNDINSLTFESLAQIFMLLPVSQRITMEEVCPKWKEACQIAWYDIKKYKFGELIDGVVDKKLLTEFYVKKLLSNFGIYLVDLRLSEFCNLNIMLPVINKHCKNLTTLEFVLNGKFKINTDHYCKTFKNLNKLKSIKINVVDMEHREKYVCFILDSLPKEINEITILYEEDMSGSPVYFDLNRFDEIRKLNLTGCNLDDIIQDISQATTLVDLHLEHSYITEECSYNAVDTFNRLDKLESIIITDDDWIIDIPNVVNIILDLCKNIRYFHVMLLPNEFENSVELSITNWKNLINLEHLGIRWSITDNAATNIVKYCKNLKSLDIVNVTDTSFQKLTQLESLEYLRCPHKNNLTNESISAISKCKKLTHLFIPNVSTSNNSHDENNNEQISSSIIFDDLSKLQYLEHLDLSDLKGFQDSSMIAVASKCKNLKSLNISFCKYITETALMSIISLEKLQVLDVSAIDGVTDNFITSLKGLKSFSCCGCENLTDAGVIQLIKNCPDLEELRLYSTPITINTVIFADELLKNCSNKLLHLYLDDDEILSETNNLF